MGRKGGRGGCEQPKWGASRPHVHYRSVSACVTHPLKAMTPAAAMAAAFCSTLLCWLLWVAAWQVTRTARGLAPACHRGGDGGTQLSMVLLVLMHIGLGA